MSNWEDKPRVQKGNLGEEIVDRYILSKGLIPYHPVFDGPHPFDRICVMADCCLAIVETKTKAHRTFFPDTGIDKKHYEKYKAIQSKYKIEVFIYFVDEAKGEIYGGSLRTLATPYTVLVRNQKINYPWEDKGIVYFPLENTEPIAHLTDAERDVLRSLSTRNYEYPNSLHNKGLGLD